MELNQTVYKSDIDMNGGSNRVLERPKWLIWTVCSYYIYRECVRSEIESARAKIFTIMLPGSQWTLCVNEWGEKVVSTLLRGRGVNV